MRRAGYKVSVFSTAFREAFNELDDARRSERAFGEELGTTQQTVNRWLNGESLPVARTVVLIAEALEEDPAKWLRLREQSIIAEAKSTARPPTRRELDRIQKGLEKALAEVADLRRRSEQ